MSDPTLVCVISYPRSGQVWLSRMLADCLGCSLTTRRKRDADYDYAADKFGEVDGVEVQRSHDSLAQMTARSEEGGDRWPDLVVYLERDPVDVCESVRTWLADGDEDQARNLVCGDTHGTFAGWPEMSEWCEWADVVVQYELLWSDPERELEKVIRTLGLSVVHDPAEVVDRHGPDSLAGKAKKFGRRPAEHGAKGGEPGRGYRNLSPDMADRVAREARGLV